MRPEPFDVPGLAEWAAASPADAAQEIVALRAALLGLEVTLAWHGLSAVPRTAEEALQ